jgi:hypothetical protein
MQWLDWWPWGKESSELKQPIDMGNGRFVAPEDLLDGHFRQLTRQSVQVQVKPNLQATIVVVAPSLAPLTAVAEEVAYTLPVVQPAPRFRQDLQRALEQTHRQQRAQRRLGTRPAPAQPPTSWGMLISGALLALILLAWLLHLRKSPHEQHPA